jgi:hypothetical protein
LAVINANVMVKVSCDLIINKFKKMEDNLRVKLINEARKNGSKFGKKAELDFGAGAEWMYNELQKELTLTDVSQRSELFAEQDSKDFILWQRDRDIRRLENGKYKWREFEYNREFFLEKYLEDRNKANCG